MFCGLDSFNDLSLSQTSPSPIDTHYEKNYLLGQKKGLSEWMNELWVDAKRVRNESLGQCFRPCSPCDEARVRITLSFPSFCRSFHILIDDTLEKELAFPVSSVKRRALSPIIHSLDCTLSLSPNHLIFIKRTKGRERERVNE